MSIFIDSHCHVNFDALRDDYPAIAEKMKQNGVQQALCVSVNLPDWDSMMAMVDAQPTLWASVGVHPGYEDAIDPTIDDLVTRAQHPKVVAIGETGLDYYYAKGDLTWQRERFRTHIRAAREAQLPLIIHTRDAVEDTLRIMEEEKAHEVGGVMHCFTESLEMAQACMAMGFYISFSGIVTFNSAKDLQETAKSIPLERMLIETDSPYLAPVPYRGKQNDPSKVIHVAEKLAVLKSVSLDQIAQSTTQNFFNLFNKIDEKHHVKH